MTDFPSKIAIWDPKIPDFSWPPEAAEKIGIFLVLGGNLASVPPLVVYTFETRGVHSLEIPLISEFLILFFPVVEKVPTLPVQPL